MKREQKAPAFPVYTKDYDTDEKVILMDLAQEGAYNRLLRHQWREGSIPANTASLAVICRVPLAKFQRVWAGRVASCFEPLESDPSRLVNRKVEAVRRDQEAYHAERSESGRRGNEAKRARHTKEDSSAYGSAERSASRERHANSTPAVAVAVPVTAATTADGSNGSANVTGGPFLSREGRLKAIEEGDGYLDEIEKLKPGCDRGWELRGHSIVRTGGRDGPYLLKLENASDKHLLRTVHALRDTVERLKGAESGERHGLLTAEEHERRRRG